MGWALPSFNVGMTGGTAAALNQCVADLELLAATPQINSIGGAYPPSGSVAQVGTPPSIDQPNYLIDIGSQTNTCNASGVAGFSFTAPFPNGVLAVFCQPADASGQGNYVELLPENTTKATFQCQVYNSGGLRARGYSVTVTWIAFGF